MLYLGIFKYLYSRIKYRSFERTKDYFTVINWIRKCSKKLQQWGKNEVVYLEQPSHSDHEFSEYTELEKLGSEPTFDHRTGNRFTRKLHIKEIYEDYYYEGYESKPGTPMKKTRMISESLKEKAIRSLDQRQGNL